MNWKTAYSAACVLIELSSIAVSYANVYLNGFGLGLAVIGDANLAVQLFKPTPK